MRTITIKGTVMILREGKMGSIIMMMMEVIIGAIYLCRADVVAKAGPPSLSLTIANASSTRTRLTPARSNVVNISAAGSLP